jgi:hypothetical protein
LSDLDKPEVSPKSDILMIATRKAALSTISRVFRRNLGKQVKKWHYSALPERQLEIINSQLSENYK